MSSEIKSITITKQAASDLMGGMLPPKRKGRTKKNLHGGGESSQPTNQIIKLDDSASSPPLSTSSSVPSVPSKHISPAMEPSTETLPSAPQYGGGIKPIRVELKKRHETKKVQLQPKKVIEQVKSLKKASAHGTRKQRKVSLGISTMHRRLTRAKKMQTRVKQMPLDTLKAQLIEKKLIKSTSKAPESVLRQIAEDAQLVASKSL